MPLLQTPHAAGMPLVLTPAGYLVKSMKRDRVRVLSVEELHAGTLARPAVEMSEGEQLAIFAQIKRAIDEVTP